MRSDLIEYDEEESLGRKQAQKADHEQMLSPQTPDADSRLNTEIQNFLTERDDRESEVRSEALMDEKSGFKNELSVTARKIMDQDPELSQILSQDSKLLEID